MTKQATRARAKAASGDPFLFLGHGFGTSERNLECYLWFARAPGERACKRIEGLLPFPVAAFARFDGELLHFGSDDDLEARVCAAYHPDYADRDPEEALSDAMLDGTEPRAREWRAFNAELEQAVAKIHATNELVAVIKPDDGTYGRKPSAWHRRSVGRATELIEHAKRRRGPVGAVASSLWMNVLEDVLPDAPAAKKLDEAARDAWLGWLPGLASKGSKELRAGFAERLGWVQGEPPATASRRAAKPAARSTKARARKGDPVASLQAALEDTAVPWLVRAGFEGKFPKFRRRGARTEVLWFELQRGPYSCVSVGVSVMAPRPGASVTDDHKRAFETRNPREYLSGMASGKSRSLLWYDDAAKKWGRAWPRSLAEHVLALIETHAEPWLAKRSRRRR